jgi:transposase
VSPPNNDNERASDWKQYARHLEGEVEALKTKLQAMQRRSFGKKSEKLPSLEREARKEKREQDRAKQQAEAARKRRENPTAKTQQETHHPPLEAPDEHRPCPSTATAEPLPARRGKTTTV